LSRILQQTKYKPEAALKLYSTLLSERVAKLPIRRQDVASALKHGFVYFHGRDVRCRPMLVIRAGRAEPLLDQVDLIKQTFLFTMEFATRYLLIPGRVENWSVLIDCEGLTNLPIFKCKGFGQAIAVTLGKVYSGRMAWTKICNFPSGFAYSGIRAMVTGIVSALGKSEKVAFVSSGGKELIGKVELGQLETWAGGSAPDLAPDRTFPYRMFADPAGAGATPVEPSSVHEMCDIGFHEGLLWADCMDAQTSWKTKAGTLPLPPGAAAAVNAPPCRTIEDWKSCLYFKGHGCQATKSVDSSEPTVKQWSESSWPEEGKEVRSSTLDAPEAHEDQATDLSFEVTGLRPDSHVDDIVMDEEPAQRKHYAAGDVDDHCVDVRLVESTDDGMSPAKTCTCPAWRLLG